MPHLTGVVTYTCSSAVPGTSSFIPYSYTPSHDIELGEPGGTQLKLSSEEDGSFKLLLQHVHGHALELRIDDSPEVKKALISIAKLFRPIE